MTCKNCGGSYHLTEEHCPYCGAINERGAFWAAHRRRAAQNLFETQAQVQRQLPLEVANRISNWLLLILSAILVLTFIIVSAVEFTSEKSIEYSKKVNKAEFEAQMHRLYTQERFGELYKFLTDKELIGQEYYIYSQMCLMNFDYNTFRQYKAEFLQAVQQNDEGLTESRMRFYIDRILDSTSDIITLNLADYSKLAPENRAVYERFCEEATAFCRAVLGMSREEVLALSNDGYCFTEDERIIEPLDKDSLWWGEKPYFTQDLPLIDEILKREAWK